MSRRFLLRFGLALLSVVVAGLSAWSLWPSPELTDLVYATPDGVPLTLDLDFPAWSRSACPVVVFVPADGNWPREFKREPRFRKFIELLTRRGYVIATIHYRDFSENHRFPAPIEDGKAAVRWLRANATQYGLDAQHIGAMGVSQGGWGATMLGTTSPEDGFEGGNFDQSSRVQAVVALGVPGDFAANNLTKQLEYDFLRPFLGTGPVEDPALYERASPGAYASADDPPILLFHSREDPLVPVEMARTLADRLRVAGVQVTLVEEEGKDHIWDGPKLERLIQQTLHFFDCHLRP